jgi:hypothetical protein
MDRSARLATSCPARGGRAPPSAGMPPGSCRTMIVPVQRRPGLCRWRGRRPGTVLSGAR